MSRFVNYSSNSGAAPAVKKLESRTEMAETDGKFEAVDHEKRPASDVVSVGDTAMTRRILLKLDFRYHSPLSSSSI